MSDRRPPAPSSPLAGRRVLLGVTGGIAAYKACTVVRLLRNTGAEVRVVMTPAATRFVGADTFAALSGRPVFTDLFQEPERVLHVRLAHEADVAVVCPATANTLAKLALGFADDLLSSVILEASCPVVVAPAMHWGMYEDAATQANLELLAQRGFRIVGPGTGALAAGDEGIGRVAEPEEVVRVVEDTVGRGRDLEGRRVLVTAGPTWEPIDAVRFVGNRSTGKMGFAVAAEAAVRGAAVTLVAGPGTVPPPRGMDDVVLVGTAAEMQDEVMKRAPSCEAIVMAAAVADFRPDRPSAGKLKKEAGPPEVRLVPNPDILLALGEQRTGAVLVGFAAETEDLEEAGRRKLEDKGVDVIVVNRVGHEGTGFGSDTNEAMILSDAGIEEPLRMWSKPELARAICDRLAKRLGPL